MPNAMAIVPTPLQHPVAETRSQAAWVEPLGRHVLVCVARRFDADPPTQQVPAFGVVTQFVEQHSLPIVHDASNAEHDCAMAAFGADKEAMIGSATAEANAAF